MSSPQREAFSQLQPDMQHLIRRTLALDMPLLRSLIEDRETPAEDALNALILDISLELYHLLIAWSEHLPAERVIAFIVDLPFEKIPDEILAGYIPILQAKVAREKAWGETALKHAAAEAKLLELIDAATLKSLYWNFYSLRDAAHLKGKKATTSLADFRQQAFDRVNKRRLQKSLPPLPPEVLPLWAIESELGLELYLTLDHSVGLI